MRKRRPLPLDRTKDKSLPSARAPNGATVNRTLQWVQGKKIILLHISTTETVDVSRIRENIHHLMFGNPTEYQGEGFIFKELGNPWSDSAQEPTANFNCHSYSLGERAGITPNDWLEGLCTDLSMDTNPTEIMFSAYLKRTITVPATMDEAERLTENPAIKDDDVISFVSFVPHWGIAHLHSGRLRRLNGALRVIGKFNQSRMMVLTLKETFTTTCLSGIPQEIRLYRPRGTN